MNRRASFSLRARLFLLTLPGIGTAVDVVLSGRATARRHGPAQAKLQELSLSPLIDHDLERPVPNARRLGAAIARCRECVCPLSRK